MHTLSKLHRLGACAFAFLAFGVISACTGAGTAAAVPEDRGWTLVWSDEFGEDHIDPDKWRHEVNCWGGGNNELQCYTDRERNSYVRDGKLHLVAREEPARGSPLQDDRPDYDPDDQSAARDYTSARLRTLGKGDWRYGRIEVRAKMPYGQGIWPAIWMMPSESVYGPWPLSGEIDILEAINTRAAGGNEIHGYLHYGERPPGNLNTGTGYTPAQSIWEQFHTYAIEWEEGEIRWYVDDTHFATQRQDGWFTRYWSEEKRDYQLGEGAAPFDQAFHLILNIAVGGEWPGPPDAQTEFPQTMVVDFVRVYACSRDRDTGRGCATVNPDVEPLEGHPAP